MLEFEIRRAINDYMQSTGATRRTAILAVNEIIKKLASECQKAERPVCYDCGFWDVDQEGCTCPAPDRQYACEIEKGGADDA